MDKQYKLSNGGLGGRACGEGAPELRLARCFSVFVMLVPVQATDMHGHTHAQVCKELQQPSSKAGLLYWMVSNQPTNFDMLIFREYVKRAQQLALDLADLIFMRLRC